MYLVTFPNCFQPDQGKMVFAAIAAIVVMSH